MAHENAVDSFIELLRQSDLVSNDRLPALIAESSGIGTEPDDVQRFAESLVKREILTSWQAEMLLQGKHRGFHLGPYRILRPLGQGGMSKVFLAEHEVMRRACAIKVLPSKYEEDPDLLNRFQLEARAIAALDHPNIVRAYDFNKDVRYGKVMHYLVMEYVDGPDLRRMVDKQGPLDYRKAADFIAQAAEGLAHAHAAGFVHRDIKPANLLVDPNGVLKVLDLGLARFNVEAEGIKNSEGNQSAVGTADYIAPEQVVDSRNVDGRADLYSLGHTFYFLLTGRRPFIKPTIMELLMAHRTEEPEPISQSRPDVPMELEAIIAKMTAKSPHQRFQSAKETAERLRQWLKDSGSGRGFSRISALMAEAMRAKKLAGQETTRMQSNSGQDTELELASLVEEPTGTAAPVETEVNSKSSNGGALEAKDKPLMPGAVKGPSSSGAMKSLSGVKAGDSKTKLSAAKTDAAADEAPLPTIPSDLLSADLPAETALVEVPSEPSPSEGGVSGPIPVLPPWKAPEPSGGLLASPWFWGIAAAVVVVVVISLLFIPFGVSLKPEESAMASSRPAVEASNPQPAMPSDAVPEEEAGKQPVDATKAPPPNADAAGQPPKESKTPIEPKQTVETPPAKGSDAPKTPEQGGAKLTANGEAHKTTDEAVGPDAMDPTRPEPPPEAAPPAKAPSGAEAKRTESAPKPPEIDKDLLFGRMTSIAFTPINSKITAPAPTVKELVKGVENSLADMVERMQLQVVKNPEKDTGTMSIELADNNDPAKPGWVIIAKLHCANPNDPNVKVQVWSDDKPLYSIAGDPNKLNYNRIRRFVRKKIDDFFKDFEKAFNHAQTRANAIDGLNQMEPD